MCTSDQETLELLSLTVEVDEFGSTIYRNTDGQWHRNFGPAMIHDGILGWYWRGLWHRVGGPARGCGSYWLFDKQFTKETYELECVNKTMPEWKKYDAEFNQGF